MLLERTIFQLDIGDVPPARARTLAQYGYMQWLGALAGHANYVSEAERALDQARPFCASSPAVSAFCGLIRASLAEPGHAIELEAATPARRGGAQARRMGL